MNIDFLDMTVSPKNRVGPFSIADSNKFQINQKTLTLKNETLKKSLEENETITLS